MDLTAFIASRRETLLISDYNTYRKQVSRQIRSTRKRLGIATLRREKFAVKPISAENTSSNHEYAQLIVMTAERAWAHAMHIKSSHSEDTTGKGLAGNTRSHLISRLHKAVKITADLVKLLKDQSATRATDQDILEATAYAASMAGAEEFERQSQTHQNIDGQKREANWQECLRQYSKARVIYATLLEKEKSDVFRELLATTIDPTIRYVAYQARVSRTIAIPTVAKRHFPQDDAELASALEKMDPYALKDRPAPKTEAEKQASPLDVPDSVTFRGRKANIVDASIGQALASVTAAEARLRQYLVENSAAPNKDRAAAYDEILAASQDAADTTKRATDELEKENTDESDPRMQDLRVTSLAVNYDLVSWRVGRNRVLIGDDDGMTFEPQQHKKSKRAPKEGSEHHQKEEARAHKLGRLRERVVLYDATIQNINSIKDLRGAMRDASFVKELDDSVAYFRALKCLNIAHSHTLVGNQINALALLKRGHDLAASVQSTSTADESDPPSVKIPATLPRKLQQHIFTLLSRTHALVEMHKMEGESAAAAAKYVGSAAPLVQDLSAYPTPGTHVDLTNLVTYPPRLEPIPVKPLFLDVAWNYIEYPSRKTVVPEVKQVDEKVADQGTPQPEKKRGWFGFAR